MQQSTTNPNKIRVNTFDKSLKTKNEVPLTFFSYLFSEIIQYILNKNDDDKEFDIEEKLSSFGYSIGEKILELSFYREKNFKRDNKIIPILQFIHNQIWKMLFNKGADGLEKSVDEVDEYRIVENTPICNKYITLPKGNSVNCAAYFSGIIEGILNSADFRCKVSACFSDTKTYYIIKFDHDVITRDAEIK